jgi:hypothetical protein
MITRKSDIAVGAAITSIHQPVMTGDFGSSDRFLDELSGICRSC